MADIVAADELPHLSVERVWVETEKALKEQHPEIFWQVLANCGALPILLPELVISDGIAALTRAAPHTQRADCRWAALLSDLPEARAQSASKRLKAPNALTLLAARVSAWRPQMKAALTDATTCMTLIKALDALRRDEPFEGFCESLSALEQQTPEATAAITLLRDARDAAQRVKAADFAEEGIKGPALGAAIQTAQIEQIAAVLAGAKAAL